MLPPEPVDAAPDPDPLEDEPPDAPAPPEAPAPESPRALVFSDEHAPATSSSVEAASAGPTIFHAGLDDARVHNGAFIFGIVAGSQRAKQGETGLLPALEFFSQGAIDAGSANVTRQA